MACLDTTAIVDLSGRSGMRWKRRVRDRLLALGREGESLVTTRFNIAELWIGIERSSDSVAEQEKVELLTAPLAVLEFDEDSARIFGRLLGRLQAHGIAIGDMDTLIASVCLVAGHSIVTRNTRHFSRVPGLIVEDY